MLDCWLDRWLDLQDVPTAERHPSLAAPLFAQLLDVLVRQCAYPRGFTCWDEHEPDEPEVASYGFSHNQ